MLRWMSVSRRRICFYNQPRIRNALCSSNPLILRLPKDEPLPHSAPHHVIPSPPVRIEESGCGGRASPTAAPASDSNPSFSSSLVLDAHMIASESFL